MSILLWYWHHGEVRGERIGGGWKESILPAGFLLLYIHSSMRSSNAGQLEAGTEANSPPRCDKQAAGVIRALLSAPQAEGRSLKTLPRGNKASSQSGGPPIPFW